MTREEELERAIEDRDEAENEAEYLSDEMHQFEIENPNDFQERDEWNAMHYDVNSYENEAMYLTSVIEDLKYQIAESEEND